MRRFRLIHTVRKLSTKQLKPLADALAAARVRGEVAAPGWQALRWELEELRVQLFAQELGVRGNVSPKKLAQRLERLRRDRIT